MVYSKPKACYGTAYNIWRYLEHDPETGRPRALAHDSSCISDAEGEWWRDMDAIVRAAGHAEKPRNGGRARTYTHYVLAPDPKDFEGLTKEAGLERVRDLACRWAEEYLGDYAWEIVYHDDADCGNIHAHIVSPVTNLVTGRKRHDTDEDWEKAKELADEISVSVGLTAYPSLEDGDAGIEADLERIAREREAKGESVPDREQAGGARTRRERVDSQAERHARARGVPLVKDSLRLEADQAAALASTFEEFRARLRKSGFDVYQNKQGALVYTDGTRRFSAAKLGRMYQTDFLAMRFMDLRLTRAAWAASRGDWEYLKEQGVRSPKTSADDFSRACAIMSKNGLATAADAERALAAAREQARILKISHEGQIRHLAELERDLADAVLVNSLSSEFEPAREAGRLHVDPSRAEAARAYEAARKRLARREVSDEASIRSKISSLSADEKIVAAQMEAYEREAADLAFAHLHMKGAYDYAQAGADFERRRYLERIERAELERWAAARGAAVTNLAGMGGSWSGSAAADGTPQEVKMGPEPEKESARTAEAVWEAPEAEDMRSSGSSDDVVVEVEEREKAKPEAQAEKAASEKGTTQEAAAISIDEDRDYGNGKDER